MAALRHTVARHPCAQTVEVSSEHYKHLREVSCSRINSISASVLSVQCLKRIDSKERPSECTVPVIFYFLETREPNIHRLSLLFLLTKTHRNDWTCDISAQLSLCLTWRRRIVRNLERWHGAQKDGTKHSMIPCIWSN